MIPIALTIAGSDPSGGAGIQADLKTFHQLRVYGTSAITVVTVQNTIRSGCVEMLDPELVGAQIDAVLEDLPPKAAKTGALGNAGIIKAIAARNLNCPLVVDPVMTGKQGGTLMEQSALAALRDLLIPLAALVTPNLDEAAELSGLRVRNPDEMREAARRISQLGPGAVLIKGGHLQVDAVDILYRSGVFTEFASDRIETRHTHGTGCTYSAAITAFLARGMDLADAIGHAKCFLQAAIRTNPGLGAGSGPLNHWADPEAGPL